MIFPIVRDRRCLSLSWVEVAVEDRGGGGGDEELLGGG